MEVTGPLWASLEWTERATLRNITLGGALVETRMNSGLEASGDVTLRLGEDGLEMHAVVRHLSPDPDALDEGLYLVGLEFLNNSPSERVRLRRLIRTWTDDLLST